MHFVRSTPFGLKAFQYLAEHIKETIDLDEYSREIHIVEQGEIIGSVFFWWGAPCAVVEAIGIDKAHRGRGRGKALLAEAEKDMVEEGCSQVTLTTLPFQAPQFYQKLGYKQIGTTPNFFEGYDLAIYRKILTEETAS
ncbi:MAG: GNAT family N-acetyltransferase [Alphaproteobacteria bacterium]|nr:GNAT family N-acetyltransferase [Alphaproteobacteria bacterium]